MGVYYTFRLGDTSPGGRWAGRGGWISRTNAHVGWLQFHNLKDIPFGTSLVAASDHGLKVMGEARRSWTMLAGLAIGGALGTSKRRVSCCSASA